MTFKEDDRDKGRVITGSSNFTRSGLMGNLEFNVELKSAWNTQSLIEQKNNYCNKLLCLKCGIGNQIIKSATK